MFRLILLSIFLISPQSAALSTEIELTQWQPLQHHEDNLKSDDQSATSRTNDVHDIIIGPVRRVTQTPYVFEPHIAVDPTNPDRLAAIVVSLSNFECFYPECHFNLLVYTSTDGGETWIEQRSAGFGNLSVDGVVSFGPDGTLYALGLTNGQVLVARFTTSDQQMSSSKSFVSNIPGSDKPWLTINQQNGNLYVPYSRLTGGDYDHLGILFQRSTNGGRSWSRTVEVERGVSLEAVIAEEAVFPIGAQVIPGDDDALAIAWLWSPGVNHWPAQLWVATSEDDGETFSEPESIADTWQFISTAARAGSYFIFYRRGDAEHQELVAGISHNGGESWETLLVSGKMSLPLSVDKAPGINIAPNGIIDVVFYAHDGSTPACFDWEAFSRRYTEGWVDTCDYNVYYTFSTDSGQSFSSPLRLNEQPIRGSRFVQTDGISRPGEYIGMASTNRYAYPIWIDTQGQDGTQAYTVCIER